MRRQMSYLDTEPLTEWQVRIREAATPCELLDIAEELRIRSEVARKEWLAEAGHANRRKVRARTGKTQAERAGQDA
jgi:hypothetical protein